MKVGRNLATITDYGLTKTKLGSAQVFIRLWFEDCTESTWYGVAFKKDGAPNEIMLMQLAYCGFDLSVNAIEDLASGPSSGLLVMDEQIDVYCRMEMLGTGEQGLRISSLGAIGPSRIDSNEVKSMISDEQNNLLKASASKFKVRQRKPKAVVENPEENVPF